MVPRSIWGGHGGSFIGFVVAYSQSSPGAPEFLQWPQGWYEGNGEYPPGMTKLADGIAQLMDDGFKIELAQNGWFICTK